MNIIKDVDPGLATQSRRHVHLLNALSSAHCVGLKSPVFSTAHAMRIKEPAMAFVCLTMQP